MRPESQQQKLDIERGVAALRSERPAEGFAQKMMNGAMVPVKTKQVRWLLPFLAASSTAGVAAVLILWPGTSSAIEPALMRELRSAVRQSKNIKSLEQRTYDISSSGKRTLTSDLKVTTKIRIVWYPSGYMEISDGKSVIQYHSEAGYGARYPQVSASIVTPSDHTFPLQWMTDAKRAKTLHVSRNVSYLGGRYDRYETTIDSPSGIRNREHMYVDPKTKQIRHYVLLDDNTPREDIEFIYDKLDPNLSCPKFPPGTRIHDWTDEKTKRNQWLSGDLGTCKVGHATVRLHAVFVDERRNVSAIISGCDPWPDAQSRTFVAELAKQADPGTIVLTEPTLWKKEPQQFVHESTSFLFPYVKYAEPNKPGKLPSKFKLKIPIWLGKEHPAFEGFAEFNVTSPASVYLADKLFREGTVFYWDIK